MLKVSIYLLLKTGRVSENTVGKIKVKALIQLKEMARNDHLPWKHPEFRGCRLAASGH